MSLPTNLSPRERAEAVRRLYALRNRVEDYAKDDKLDLRMRFILSDILTMADHTAAWVKLGFDITSDERNAA